MARLQSCTLIPKTVTWVSGIASMIPQGCLSKRYERDEGRLLRTTSVVDSKNKRTLATATHQAGQFPTIVERPNVEIPELELYDYHAWGAKPFYRVIADGEYLLELGMDVMLDCGLSTSINEGVIKGPFVFARTQTGVRLVRVNGPLYNQAIEYKERQKSVLKKDQLQYGHLYQAVVGAQYVYLGEVEDIDSSWNSKTNTYGPRHIRGSWVFPVGVAGVRQLTDMLEAGKEMEPYWFAIRETLRVSRDLGEVPDLPSCADLCKRIRAQKGVTFCSPGARDAYIPSGVHIRPVGSTELPSREAVAKVRRNHGGYPASYVIPEDY